ncbi:hypothetical protein L6164_001837 [Bauhinia variegata]|uniref:Uncharacterized protein n=1 Tax=Bauhinia variegata TaxID=167791 RepID=A0ACB9QBS9_BAUVA|nr:hypothetical protein L6164_001837 [Bauhinia variegata]
MPRRVKKKTDQGTHADLISDLPRNVIDGILEHLPIRDAVRTSILSRKWRYMWVTSPRLEFDDKFFNGVMTNSNLGDYEIPNVITEVLLLHDGPINKFVLDIPPDYPVRIRCLGQWILFLSRNRINDLELVNQQAEAYEIPSHLFSCLDLTYLELSNFRLATPPDFSGFQSLAALHCYDIRFASTALENFICGCPLLEELTISYCSGFESLNISAASLKILYIEDARVIKSICFKKAKNLIDLTIILNRSAENVDGGRRSSNLTNFFSYLPKIEKLCLVDGYIKFLSSGSIPETLPKLLYNLKHLELDGINFNEAGDTLLTVCLLRSSPNLVELDIKSHTSLLHPALNLLEGLDCNGFCLEQLRTVNIEVKSVSDTILDLVQFLLTNSPSMEVLTFKVGLRKQSDAYRLLNISRDLLQLGRASPRAEINFLYEGVEGT